MDAYTWDIRDERLATISEDIKTAENRQLRDVRDKPLLDFVDDNFHLLKHASKLQLGMSFRSHCDVVMIRFSLRGKSIVVWLQVNKDKLCGEEPRLELKTEPVWPFGALLYRPHQPQMAKAL